MSNGNDDEVTNDGTADPAPAVSETSTHPADGVIPSSYGAGGGTVEPAEGDRDR